MNVYILGSGKLAEELIAGLKAPHITSVNRFSALPEIPLDDTVVVHAGSGRELPAAYAVCSRHGLALFELATGGASDTMTPNFPLIVCANTNVLMLRFMAMVRRSGAGFDAYPRTITESHQAAKTTEAGTARNLAESLGIPAEEIVSVRDPGVQERDLAIPAEHLSRHAFHRIVIGDSAASITLESRVLGPAPYAAGLAEILRIVMGEEPEAGVHEVLDYF